MMNALRTVGRVSRKILKFGFWTFVVLMTLSGILHLVAAQAPPHMQSSAQTLKNGDRILHDGQTGNTYYFPANTASGTVIEPIKQPRKTAEKETKTVVFDLPGDDPKVVVYDLLQ